LKLRGTKAFQGGQWGGQRGNGQSNTNIQQQTQTYSYTLQKKIFLTQEQRGKRGVKEKQRTPLPAVGDKGLWRVWG